MGTQTADIPQISRTRSCVTSPRSSARVAGGYTWSYGPAGADSPPPVLVSVLGIMAGSRHGNVRAKGDGSSPLAGLGVLGMSLDELP